MVTLLIPPPGWIDPHDWTVLIGGFPQGTVLPSGDTTGGTDTTAIKGTPGLVQLGAGDFWINPNQITLGPGQGLRGLGAGLTRIFVVGGVAGQAGLTFRNASFPTVGDPFAKTNLSCPSGGFFLDGTSATAGVNGIEAGDIYLLNLTAVQISNFAGGAGAIGMYFCNRIGWTERAHVRVFIDNCDVAVAWDVQGGTNSFAYSDEIISVHQLANQNGFSWRNGAQVYGGAHLLTGNFQTAVTNTGVALDFGSDNSGVHWFSDQASVVVEANGATLTHKSINIGTGADLRIDRLAFRGATWTAGSLGFGNVTQTRINLELNEPTLGTTIPRLMKHANITVLPSATAGVFGAATTITPDARWTAFLITGFFWTPNGTAGENITIQVTTTYSDGSTSVTTPAAVLGTAGNQNFNLSQMGGAFYKPLVAAVSFQVQTQSTINSSTATPQFTVTGENRM